MNIRKTTLADAKYIAPLILLATEEIVYEFIQQKSAEQASNFMHHFVAQEANQYSYQNCWVAEEQGQIVSAVALYDGGQLSVLRKPIADYIQENYGLTFQPEDETEAGEFYIDSFGVDAQQQGKGIGAKMLQFLIDEYVHKNEQKLGLLVDKENPLAKKLYLKLGFKVVGEKTLVGKKMEHLQIG